MSYIAELVAHFRVHLQNLNKSEHTIKQYTIDCKQLKKNEYFENQIPKVKLKLYKTGMAILKNDDDVSTKKRF